MFILYIYQCFLFFFSHLQGALLNYECILAIKFTIIWVYSAGPLAMMGHTGMQKHRTVYGLGSPDAYNFK